MPGFHVLLFHWLKDLQAAAQNKEVEEMDRLDIL
jgi:hypothetical protein